MALREVSIRLTVNANGEMHCDVGPEELAYLFTKGPVTIEQWGRYGEGQWAGNGEEKERILEILAKNKKQ